MIRKRGYLVFACLDNIRNICDVLRTWIKSGASYADGKICYHYVIILNHEVVEVQHVISAPATWPESLSIKRFRICMIFCTLYLFHTFRHKPMHALLRYHLPKLQIISPLHIPHHISCSIPGNRITHTNFDPRRGRSIVATRMASNANVASHEVPSRKLNDGTSIPLVKSMCPATNPS